jgi:hypothetical protein
MFALRELGINTNAKRFGLQEVAVVGSTHGRPLVI